MKLLKKSRGDCRNYRRAMDTYHKSKREAILKTWKKHLLSRNEALIDTSAESLLFFLHGIYSKTCLYSRLWRASSALSSVVCINGFSKLSNHPMISRHRKGILFDRHPPLPKYIQIWKTNEALDYYTNLPDIKELEFKYFGKKLVMLFFIVIARMKQALFAINIGKIIFADNEVVL